MCCIWEVCKGCQHCASVRKVLAFSLSWIVPLPPFFILRFLLTFSFQSLQNTCSVKASPLQSWLMKSCLSLAANKLIWCSSKSHSHSRGMAFMTPLGAVYSVHWPWSWMHCLCTLGWCMLRDIYIHAVNSYKSSKTSHCSLQLCFRFFSLFLIISMTSHRIYVQCS